MKISSEVRELIMYIDPLDELIVIDDLLEVIPLFASLIMALMIFCLHFTDPPRNRD